MSRLGAILAVLCLLIAPAAADPIRVELKVERPLRLQWFGGKDGEAGLVGKVAVTLRNEGPTPVVLRDLEQHGLVFRSVKDGRLHVLVHSCACVKEAGDPGGSLLSLAPGEVHRVVLEDFGCGGGMWDPPPPGSYDVDYRVLPGPTPAAQGTPGDLTAACRAAFTAEDTWEGAPHSPPIRVTLRAPRRKGGK